MSANAVAAAAAGLDPAHVDLESLEASWELRVTLLGIGGAFDADRGIANTAALLELCEPDRVLARYLIDCGHTTGRQLHGLGLTYDDIDAVLLTHAHGDHMDGLEIYGYRGRFICGRRGRLLSDGSVLACAWAALRAKMGWLKTSASESRPACIDDYFHAEAVCPEGVLLGGGRLRASFFPVPHIPHDRSCGIRVELAPGQGAGPVLRWSGDTTFCNEGPLTDGLDPARGDLLFHECSFDPLYETTVHTHVEELASLSEAQRSAIVLVHHGRVQSGPARVHGMTLGQPFQRFTLRPYAPAFCARASDGRAVQASSQRLASAKPETS